MDAFKNGIKVTVSLGYDAAATSIVLTTGHGARLPAVPFNAVWFNATDYGDPSDDPNVEVVRVTAVSTDTLTVSRAAETMAQNATAQTHNTASKTYRMIPTLTAKTLNSDIYFTSKARAYISSAQSPTANTLTVVNFGTENYDVDNEFNLTTDRFVATVTGYYLVTSQIYFTGLVDQNDYSVYIYKNGAVVAQKLQTASGANGMMVTISDVVPLAATDYVEIRVRRQNTGAIEVGTDFSFVAIHRLS